MNMLPSVIYLLFFITRQCGYYDLTYSSDILGIMEIEIYIKKSSTEVKNILSRLAR